MKYFTAKKNKGKTNKNTLKEINKALAVIIFGALFLFIMLIILAGLIMP